ncbi:hypothetical protein [Rhodococcoides fascians]|nr:hypothetical protein [Rhodococcus fascians]
MGKTRDRLERLLAGGPDTPIRTKWHDGVEYWEVPADELRAVLRPQGRE